MGIRIQLLLKANCCIAFFVLTFGLRLCSSFDLLFLSLWVLMLVVFWVWSPTLFQNWIQVFHSHWIRMACYRWLQTRTIRSVYNDWSLICNKGRLMWMSIYLLDIWKWSYIFYIIKVIWVLLRKCIMYIPLVSLMF